MKRAGKPEGQKRIAEERIARLFQLAGKEFRESPELSDRYVKLAWKICLKFNISLSTSQKARFCRKCLSYLGPGRSKTRVSGGYREIRCLKCGNRSRYSIRKRKVLK